MTRIEPKISRTAELPLGGARCGPGPRRSRSSKPLIEAAGLDGGVSGISWSAAPFPAGGKSLPEQRLLKDFSAERHMDFLSRISRSKSHRDR